MRTGAHRPGGAVLPLVPGVLVATLMTVALAVPALTVAGTAPAAAGTTPRVVRAALPPGRVDHIFVIDLENEGYDATFGPGSPATYLNGPLRRRGELLVHYYGIGHDSLDNYIAQVSGQSPTRSTQGDCAADGAAFGDVTPGTPAPQGQVVGQGCVYPASVPTVAAQLDARYPPNPRTHVAAWRAYLQDMGADPARDGGVPDPTGGTDCGHPAIGGTTAEAATPEDQYATRHNPFVWFHSVIDDAALCDANVVPLGSLGPSGVPDPGGHLARDLARTSTTPKLAFIIPNLCNDGHDATCVGPDSVGGHTGGLAGADLFLRHWVPLLMASPAYRAGTMLVVITFDEADVDASADPDYAAACCDEQPGPNTAAPGNAGVPDGAPNTAPGGGQTGALLLDRRYLVPGSVDRAGAYNHYSALRSYEDLLGLTSGGTDGHGHLGWAAAPGLRPFGKDVFHR